MTENKRNYGIDLLRIVSMQMIVMLHVLGAGGILGHVAFGSPNYFASWGLENLILCAVNCYALISGYVGIYSTFKLKNIVSLWLQVEFYSLGIALLLYFLCPGVFGVSDILKSGLPVLFERYWYFTAYFLMFFFVPFMQRFVLGVSKATIVKFLAIVFVLLSVLPTLVDKDVFYTMNGYSALWLIVMYILGAAIRHHGLWQKKSAAFYLGIFGGVIACNWIVKFGLAYLSIRLTGAENAHTNVLLEYTSPTIIAASVMLLILFSKFNLGKASLTVVKFLSPLTFGVYLIHMQPMLWTLFGESPFAYLVEYPIYKAAPWFVGIVVSVYLACSLLEWVRRLLFRLLHVPAFEAWVSEKAYCFWNRLLTRL